ncbi:origin recognition complex subunit 3 [Coccinella septempunctata]|uniref:origin recognition complex subunit 3 n=1 Tax=Coccinella septempunctata TaxID=41139 RepID=UPI001D05FFC9|nr:origin recognition complex subunit 3 [Coccinella septempunctata]XP_044751601.1 origin recognition complex subunit 3 [Coccinella septempunctata]
MSSGNSVSKGVFVFKNGFKRPSKLSKHRKKEKSIFSDHLWYQSFSSLWRNFEEKLHLINTEIFSSTLKDLVNFVNLTYDQIQSEIPTAALLTGINMPDHEAQFSALTKEIKEYVTPHCVVMRAQDCSSIKLFVENMINGFLNDEDATIEDMYEDYEEEESNYIKKSRCTFAVLQAWYESLYLNNSILNYSDEGSFIRRGAPTCKPLVVIIPDIENFSENVIQDFISIAHSYINIIPFVLIFGVATSLNILHRTLPYHVSSKTSIKVFSSQPSTTYLNNILENVFFSGHCPFSLSGKVFNLLTDIFLFYDLSVTGFVKHFKFAMMEHFSRGNEFSLCTNRNFEDVLDQFKHEDFESLRRIYSFRDLVERESYRNQIKLLEDDDYLKDVVLGKLKELRKYVFHLHLFIRCLHVLVNDLPKTPLGKQVRELYAYATTKNITKSQHFNECFQLLNFQSKDQFTKKLTDIIKILENTTDSIFVAELEGIHSKLKEFLMQLGYIDSMTEITQNFQEQIKIGSASSRVEFKNKLKSISQNQSKNAYEKLREEIVEYLRTIFEKYLVEYSSLHFHEIFFFDDIDIQNQLIGTHRSAIHEALNDPQTYLQCTCCEIRREGAILPTMPDICIAYKLHLECGKMINLYDWLQAFLSILDPTDEEDDDGKRRVDPELQARFTQAVAELEYLGFIKTSKRKADHVQRLTWGG